MKFKISVTLQLKPQNITADNLRIVLQPENDTLDTVQIQTKVSSGMVVTDISGEMNLGTLLRTLDDLLATASLAANVANMTYTSDEDIL